MGRQLPALELHKKVCFASVVTFCQEFAKPFIAYSTSYIPGPHTSCTMRLRLVVRRHNLPDAAVVWAVEPCENPTVSQLLEQVNEIIPLESGGDWGLEDYSVEIKGSDASFECLHFQLVRTILHDDDEVM